MSDSTWTLADGREVLLDETRANDARIRSFEVVHERQRWCLGSRGHDQAACLHCHEQPVPGPAVVASLHSSEVIGDAHVTRCSQVGQLGHLALTIASGYQEAGLAPELVRRAAKLAKAEGYKRLMACFVHQPHDAMRDCQAAGLHVESALNDFGVTEVVLSLE